MKDTKEEMLPIYESRRVCLILAYCGGFMEAFTYLLHGKVFCNAATGNFALMAIAFAQGRIKGGFYYLIPLAAYACGIVFSEKLPNCLKRLGTNWRTVFIFAEACVMVGLGFLPNTLPDPFFTVPVTFVCAIQYNSFTKLRGAALSTTFCTNNLRQASKNIVKAIDTKNSAHINTACKYLLAILFFTMGVFTGAILILNFWGGKAILWIAFLLFIVFLILLHNNLRLHKSAKQIAAGNR